MASILMHCFWSAQEKIFLSKCEVQNHRKAIVLSPKIFLHLDISNRLSEENG